MSKVVHLSDDAHARAKNHCQRAGLKMSEWVAVLIERATAERAAFAPPTDEGGADLSSRAATAAVSASTAAPVVQAAELEEESQNQAHDEGGMPLYAAPPFWAHPAHAALSETSSPL